MQNIFIRGTCITISIFIKINKINHKNELVSNVCYIFTRGGVEDTTFLAKDSKKKKNSRPRTNFSGTDPLRPRTGMVEAKVNDGGHNFSKLWSVNFE